MAELINGVLIQLDENTMYIVIGIFLFTAILTLIRKAIKITIVMIILALLITAVIPVAKDIQDKYGVRLGNGCIILKIDGNDVTIDKNSIKDIKITKEGVFGHDIEIKYSDGLSKIKVPDFMMTEIRKYFEREEIPVSE